MALICKISTLKIHFKSALKLNVSESKIPGMDVPTNRPIKPMEEVRVAAIALQSNIVVDIFRRNIRLN